MRSRLGGDTLQLHAEALGEPQPLTFRRVGDDAFARPGHHPGGMTIAVDDDLLYFGPMALARS